MSKKYDFSYLDDLDEYLKQFQQVEEVQGEQWHDEYLKHPDIFDKLLKSDRQLEDGLQGHFRKFGKRASEFINWNLIEKKQAQEDVVDDEESLWEQWNEELLAVLLFGMAFAVEAGGESAQRDTGIDIGWTSNSTPAIEFLRNYNLSLVKGLTRVTRKRLRSALITSLELGEDRTRMTSRVAGVIDDPKRASTIAHTESVRAYSQGKIIATKEMGFEAVKIWLDGQVGACPVCSDLDREEVPVDETFSIGIDGNPAHPNCRCGMAIEIRKK